jgi:predicted DNA-binding transcriptional regulator AlpA
MDVVNPGVSDCILRMRQVMAACGKSRSAIYKDMQRGLFPRQINASVRVMKINCARAARTTPFVLGERRSLTDRVKLRTRQAASSTPSWACHRKRASYSQKDYSVEISAFYTIGKDFAFEWLEKNPNATWDQLVAAVLEGQNMLPAGIAGTTAEKLADRVFAVTGRSVN